MNNNLENIDNETKSNTEVLAFLDELELKDINIESLCLNPSFKAS